jgi:hypothetical protein
MNGVRPVGSDVNTDMRAVYPRVGTLPALALSLNQSRQTDEWQNGRRHRVPKVSFPVTLHAIMARHVDGPGTAKSALALLSVRACSADIGLARTRHGATHAPYSIFVAARLCARASVHSTIYRRSVVSVTTRRHIIPSSSLSKPERHASTSSSLFSRETLAVPGCLTSGSLDP